MWRCTSPSLQTNAYLTFGYSLLENKSFRVLTYKQKNENKETRSPLLAHLHHDNSNKICLPTPHLPLKVSNKGTIWEHSSSRNTSITVTLTNNKAEWMIHTCLQGKQRKACRRNPHRIRSSTFNHDVSKRLCPMSQIFLELCEVWMPQELSMHCINFNCLALKDYIV